MPAPGPQAMLHLALREDRPGLLRTACHLGILAAGVLAVTLAEGWWLAPAILLLGMGQAALFAPFHETSHYTAFASRPLNRLVGWAAATPLLHSWPLYQHFHRAHHLHTHEPGRDPELMVPEPRTWPQYLLRIGGWTFWRARIGWLWDGLRGDVSAHWYVPEGQRPAVVRALRLQLAIILALGAALVLLGGWRTLLLYWVLPQLVGQPLLRMYLLTEHTGLPHVKDGTANTRTTLTTRFLRLLMWNMPYHAEHHLYPFIPFHRLAEAHALVRDKLQAIQPGYGRWQWDYARSLPRGDAA